MNLTRITKDNVELFIRSMNYAEYDLLVDDALDIPKISDYVDKKASFSIRTYKEYYSFGKFEFISIVSKNDSNLHYFVPVSGRNIKLVCKELLECFDGNLFILDDRGIRDRPF